MTRTDSMAEAMEEEKESAAEEHKQEVKTVGQMKGKDLGGRAG